MFFNNDGTKMQPIIVCDSVFNETDEVFLEVIKFLQMQINRLEKDNKNIKRELNRLKKQVTKSKLGE